MSLIGLLLVTVASALIAYISLRPDGFNITRSAVIDAAPEAIYAEINDFHNWEKWSPWAKLDPNAKYEFGGSPLGYNSTMSWSGDKKVGVGKMTIVESRQNERVRLKLEFTKPMKATNDVVFDLKPVGEKTEVVWSMTGKHDFMGKAFDLFMNLDKMVGAQYEQGLANLASVLASQGGALAARGGGAA